jgi:hypothetical protein
VRASKVGLLVEDDASHLITMKVLVRPWPCKLARQRCRLVSSCSMSASRCSCGSRKPCASIDFTVDRT